MLLNNVFMFTLHYVWFQYVMFELYLLGFFLLKYFIFYLSFRCIIKMISSLGATSSFSDAFSNLNMWSVVCVWLIEMVCVCAAGMMRCDWWCICDLISYLEYFQQAEKTRLAQIYFVHIFSLPCLFVAVPCNVIEK